MVTKIQGMPLPEALGRMGSLAQCARIDALTHDDGPMRGSRLLRVVTGGGLTFEVHPDRALDIGSLEIGGKNCAWLSPTRIANPSLYDGSAPNFLRTFGGGFLMTCGLDHTGPRADIEGKNFPQHGRIGATPAFVTRTEVTNEMLCIEGRVTQVAAMQEHLELKRRIEAPLGGTSFRVTDTVTNLGHVSEPHLIMYHCNFGFPLLTEKAKMHIDSVRGVPQTADAEASPFAELHAPVAGERECVYLHEMKPGRVKASLENGATGVRMTMHFDSAVLPSLVEWKMLAKGVFALGLEPTNARALGNQKTLHDKGMLPMLEPGQQVTYELAFELEAL